MLKYITLICCLSLFSTITYAKTYGSALCKNTEYTCIKVRPGDSWERLFPNPRDREIVRKVNRMNIRLSSGMLIAVPRALNSTDFLELAPFPRRIAPTSSGMVKVDLSKLAWGAYDSSGQLLNWGPVSGGQNYCSDIKRGCKTVTGTYKVYRKQGAGCVSSKYPRPNGGAPMPYCMHFHGGYALHGSATVPGYNASHGCVRMFPEDARWLNQLFVKVGTTIVNITR